MKKFLMFGGVGLALVGVFVLFVFQPKEEEFVIYESFDDFAREVDADPVKIQEYEEGLTRAYAEDTYGGATPKETWDLFVKALKAGDTDLAAKYFIPEKQARMAEDFAIGKENGGVEMFLGTLEDDIEGSYYSNSSSKYQFYIVDEQNVIKFSFDLILNELTNVWKIESL